MVVPFLSYAALLLLLIGENFPARTQQPVSQLSQRPAGNQWTPHPIQRRYLAERLVRLRRADEHQRYASAQRQGRIDPNPHQIDAVIFAVKRIPEGGCITSQAIHIRRRVVMRRRSDSFSIPMPNNDFSEAQLHYSLRN